MKINSPLDAYKYLPGTNCGRCGEDTCMAFASHLIDRSKSAEDCLPMVEEDKYAKKLEELEKLLAPEIREVTIGTGEKSVTIGGDDVLFRHKLTFFNKTAYAYDVTDTMDDKELEERINTIQTFKKFYVGEFLTLDMVAVRCVSGKPETFADTVKKVIGLTELPLVLCSFDTAVLKAALEVAADKKPLMYAANQENWKEVAGLAKEYEVPVTLFTPNDLDLLKSMAKTFAEMGIEELVLDPGTFPTGKEMKTTFENFLKIRRAGIGGDGEVAYPIMAVPLTAWMAYDDDVSASYWETVVASVLTVKYGDIMIMHSIEPYALLPEMHLRDTIYTDPRKPVTVDPGVWEVGSPTADSPIIVTTNFALTYYTVESDISSNKIDCYIVVADTEGIGVEAAVAGGQLTADKIKKTLENAKFDLKEKTSYNTVILPGLSARLQGDVEDKVGSKVLIGPADSGRLPGWLEKNWPPQDK
ncbi:acetyl-CoA decarbonylase/synthase complex subunit gamma [Methanohalophilus halophilus]|uniref:Acetyl-CoA decarbonylase/synthase complex subunit gamma n=1 Tax=Methanohalophilus halophilus TaxID=2177 RepID=A0A1L3Q3C6_9EURY|nr:acetyl-CoA decarbonylase/synthase complex subunit gamma [Methanohalophilus halophilus]APH39369.1 acetyl-CoA synthase subunit gamma [Methanohalophilus halophilus]RNI07662.1 acetyl-CoA decarbonylase/synthase complex subunit gamma [Methanohalophilus halophilus]SDX03932.1 acetyl-CoA decarbonylase/synthase gamma subunit [Methanohalophilus halophilus]